jgi:hypothetical protein
MDKVKCDHMAKGYPKLVRSIAGDKAWSSAQGEACDCC